MKELENPQAFPSKEIDYRESATHGSTVYHDQERGMLLRDYFAAKAMNGMFTDHYKGDMETKSRWAYEMADAMLKARTKNQ